MHVTPNPTFVCSSINLSSRTIVAIVAGAFAGMFGFTGLQGVAVYLVFMALATVLSLAKMNFKVEVRNISLCAT